MVGLEVWKESHGVNGVFLLVQRKLNWVATVCFALEIPFWIKMIYHGMYTSGVFPAYL